MSLLVVLTIAFAATPLQAPEAAAIERPFARCFWAERDPKALVADFSAAVDNEEEYRARRNFDHWDRLFEDCRQHDREHGWIRDLQAVAIDRRVACPAPLLEAFASASLGEKLGWRAFTSHLQRALRHNGRLDDAITFAKGAAFDDRPSRVLEAAQLCIQAQRWSEALELLGRYKRTAGGHSPYDVTRPLRSQCHFALADPKAGLAELKSSQGILRADVRCAELARALGALAAGKDAEPRVMFDDLTRDLSLERKLELEPAINLFEVAKLAGHERLVQLVEQALIEHTGHAEPLELLMSEPAFLDELLTRVDKFEPGSPELTWLGLLAYTGDPRVGAALVRLHPSARGPLARILTRARDTYADGQSIRAAMLKRD